MKAPNISIIMPIYNAEPILEETLTCLLNQSFTDFELICVNDGSTDKTADILKRFAKKFSGKMRIISQKNSGPGVARNRGIVKSKGKYLAILDADDIYEPNMLELAYQQIIADDGDLVVMRSDEYHPDTQTYISTPWTINSQLLPSHAPFAGADIHQNIFEAFVGWPWDKLIRTDFVRQQKLHFQEIRSSEDASFCFMSIVLAQKISVIDDVLIHHRKIKGSVSNTREKTWECFYSALLEIRQQLIKHNLFERFERDFTNYSLNFSLWHLTTLTGTAYFDLYKQLKKSWWHNLKIDQHSSAYYYSPYHYELYQSVMSHTAEEFLFCYLQKKTQELESRNQEIAHLHTENYSLKQSLDERNQEISDLRNSHTWKIGHAIMTPVRCVKTILKH